MSFYARFMRKWFPKTYVVQGLKRAEEANRKALRGASPDKRGELREQLLWELREWIDWAQEIEDNELILKAKKMGIYLDEIPLPLSEAGEQPSHYEAGSFGNIYLSPEARIALRIKVREYEPTFQKNRREAIGLAGSLIAGATGLVGAATGLISLLRTKSK